MAKRKMIMNANDITLRKAFKDFTVSKSAKGVKEKTISTYILHFNASSKYLDMDMTFSKLSKSDLETMIVSMRKAGLSHNSIGSYVRTINTFLHWCSGEGYTNLTLPKIKEKETVKDTYSDEELELLLRRPSADCQFCEYRNWVIVNP